MATDEKIEAIEARATVAALNRELDAINVRLLEACERYVRERTQATFDAWLAVNREYVATHRRWWALTSPDVDYDAVFGSAQALSQEAILARHGGDGAG